MKSDDRLTLEDLKVGSMWVMRLRPDFHGIEDGAALDLFVVIAVDADKNLFQSVELWRWYKPQDRNSTNITVGGCWYEPEGFLKDEWRRIA